MNLKKNNQKLKNLIDGLPDNFVADNNFQFQLNRLNNISKNNYPTSYLDNISVLDSLPNPAFILSTSGSINKINQICENLLGYAESELVNKPFSDLFYDEMISDFFLKELSKNISISGVEVELKTKDGSIVPFLISCSVLNLLNKETLYICIAQDILEIKKNQEILHAAKLKADEANKAKSEFLANMSHEIRTPLNGVIGLNNLMLETEMTEEQEDYSKSIQISADLLLRLINDILDFSKIEAGKLDIEEIEFSPKELIKKIGAIFNVVAKEKGLVIETELDAGIADVLIGDMARIRQILINLIGNAIKFTEKGKIIISLLLHEEIDDKQVIKFSVRDTGIGISMTKQKYIFDTFSQADASTTRKYGGTGLGLSICRKLVWLMKGEMNVFSRESQGSTFWFTIPLKNNSEQVEFIAKSKDKESINNSSGLEILLVEDNFINQKVADRLLTNNGFNVAVANNGKEALEMFSEKNFDLILMDLQMPVMDGLTASKKIREVDSGIPIIALTANAMKGDEGICLAAGMNGYVTKPIKKEELFNTIDNLVYKPIELEL